MALKILCSTMEGTFDITNIITHISWSGDIKACGRKLEFKALNKMDIPISSCIMLYEDNKLLFKGFIFERSRESTNETIDYLSFDTAEKMNKIKVSYNFKGKNANEIANTVLRNIGFNVGQIAKANVPINKVFIGNSIYDIIMSAYTEQSKADGKKYMTVCIGDKIHVVEKGISKLNVTFEESKNILNSSFKESISNMVNRVIIVDDSGIKTSEVKDESMLKMHGLFQEVYKIEEGKDANIEAKKLLHGIDKTCSLEGFGDTSCVSGYGVQIKDSSTGLVGLFYIDSDTHTWEGGKYTISLELNFYNIMHEVNAGEDENKENETNEGGTTVSGGREVNALFTAYYPDNSSMEGGYYAANGERLDPGKLTCACPKEIAFNTKIQVKGTNTNRDNLVYRCNDRGGAIKVVNGVYHIDLLMSSRKEANSFGRRRGKAIIGCDVKNINSSGNDKGSKIIEFAKSKLGCKYVWGATGPNTFDCSGLTQWCHKQVGINIPRTSSQQRNGGQSISKSNAKKGDIICFAGHVGLYAGDGKMIHAPNSEKPVKYDPCFSGYWAERVLSIRRYW